MDEPEPPKQVQIAIPIRTLLVVSAYAAVVALAIVSFGTLLSMLVAAVIALGLDPVVAGLVDRGWQRGLAAVVTLGSLVVGVCLIIIATIGPIWRDVVAFIEQLPALWDEITSSQGFHKLSDATGADNAIHKFLEKVVSGLPDAATALLGVAGQTFGSALSLVTLAFLSLFLLMERPAITHWAFGFAPPAVQRRWEPVVERSISAVSSTLIGNVAISFVAGTVALIACLALGLPFPLALAVITGLLDLIPQVGATVAAVILVLVALTVSTPAAIIMAIVQLVYQQIENYVVYPIVYRRAVELSGLTTIAAVMIAGTLLGVVGAILAVPFAAVIKTVMDESSAPRRQRMAALREAEAEAAGVAEEPGS